MIFYNIYYFNYFKEIRVMFGMSVSLFIYGIKFDNKLEILFYHFQDI